MRYALSISLVGLVLLAACHRNHKPEGSAPSASVVTIKGSDTMVHLMAEWAEAFMTQRPDVQVSVTGGGSGTGIASLINGTLDICAASRDMSASEKEKAVQKGITPHETVVARDGIAVVVHPSNPVSELSIEQLRKIYTGSVGDWSQVGGGEGAIQVLSRESSSGTYVFFQEHVLSNEDFAPTTLLMPATSSIVQSVSSDVNTIGYVGLGYAAEARDKVKVLPIKATADMPAVVPTDETVANGTYSIARPLYLYTNGEPTGANAEFIAFCLSEEGQQIVRRAGYVQVK